MNKKGAIELSMTTIIIIVMGVTMLVLGLVWVRNLMGGVTDLSDDALKAGQQQIEEMMQNANQPLTMITTKVDLEQNSDDSLGMIVVNDGSAQAEYIVETTMSTKIENGIECYILDSESTTDSFSLTSGAKESEQIGILDNGNTAIGTYSCRVDLLKNGEKIADDVIIINVV